MDNNMNNILNNSNSNTSNNNSLIIKTIYGIIGGIQSIINIISGFCDIFFLGKEFKIYILDNIFKGIKMIIKFLKYILNFDFINNKTSKLITNIISLLGISLCLIMLLLIKKEKENYLNKLQKEEKSQIYLSLNSIE